MQTKERTKTFTCRLGSFIFKDDGSLSLSEMKLIRDSVLGAWYNPPEHGPKLSRSRNPVAAIKGYVANNLRFPQLFVMVLSEDR